MRKYKIFMEEEPVNEKKILDHGLKDQIAKQIAQKNVRLIALIEEKEQIEEEMAPSGIMNHLYVSKPDV